MSEIDGRHVVVTGAASGIGRLMALAVARLMGPGDEATAEGMEAQADRLSETGARFPNDPAARQARLEAARLRLTAATRVREAGGPAADWMSYLRKAQDDLLSLSGDPQLQDAATQLNAQIAGILNSANSVNNTKPAKPFKPSKGR